MRRSIQNVPALCSKKQRTFQGIHSRKNALCGDVMNELFKEVERLQEKARLQRLALIFMGIVLLAAFGILEVQRKNEMRAQKQVMECTRIAQMILDGRNIDPE